MVICSSTRLGETLYGRRVRDLCQTWLKILRNVPTEIGYDNMTEYYFGQKKKAHKFCKTCGTSILIDLKRNEYGIQDPEKDQLAVNVKHLFPSPGLIFLIYDAHVEDIYPVISASWLMALTVALHNYTKFVAVSTPHLVTGLELLFQKD
jgi:hypothetical protein